MSEGLEHQANGSLLDICAKLVTNQEIALGIYRAEFLAPQIAERVLYGQFVHLQVPNFDGHVLRRPFSVCSWDREKKTLSIIYQVVGDGTRKLAQAMPGAESMMIGPVGRGWKASPQIKRGPAQTNGGSAQTNDGLAQTNGDPTQTQRVSPQINKALLICGGVGVAPLLMLAKHLAISGTEVFCLLGATSADRLLCADELRAAGVKLCIATDDGSAGHAGFCTDLIADNAAGADYVAICGPEPMEMAAYRALDNLPENTLAKNVLCEVSMERRMACGIGACLSCVVDTKEGKKRVCVDGPVFEMQEIVW